MPGNGHVPFGKGPSEKDPCHGHLVGGLLHSGLVNMLREAGRWEEALAVCDRTVQYHPAVGHGYVLRAITRRLAASATGGLTFAGAVALRRGIAADLASAERCGPVDPETTELLRALMAGLPEPPAEA